jgi:hypothetical protein
MGEERVILVTLGEGHQPMGLSTAQVLWFPVTHSFLPVCRWLDISP